MIRQRVRALLVCGSAYVLSACSSTPATNNGSDASAEVGAVTCAAPGQPTPGPADTHCAASDAGPATVQPTNMSSCHPDAAVGDDAGSADAGPSCPYGDTMYGQESDDDDCKYHVKWRSTELCEGGGGVTFTVTVTHKTDGTPLTGAGTAAEFFTTSPPPATCDDVSTHPGKNSGVTLTEGPPGTYTGNLIFDRAGAWTVRFHFHEECADVLPDSPHGHAAYHITVP